MIINFKVGPCFDVITIFVVQLIEFISHITKLKQNYASDFNFTY